MKKALLIGLGAVLFLCVISSALSSLTGGNKATPTPTAQAQVAVQPVVEVKATSTAAQATATARPTETPPITAQSTATTQPTIPLKPTATTAIKPTATTPPQPTTAPAPTGYKVVDVVDGDTIKVNVDGKVETIRIIGLDTPETKDPRKPVQCFGREASAKAHELLNGKSVVIVPDPTQDTRDKYDRLLGYVEVDGTDYGLWMIANGYAHEYTYETPYQRQAQYKAAYQQARAKELGFWAANTCDGDTIQAADAPAVAATPVPAAAPSAGGEVSEAEGEWVTSSHRTAKLYYHKSDSRWQNLSAQYRVWFKTVDDLLAHYDREPAK